jgi:hypothetical protein
MSGRYRLRTSAPVLGFVVKALDQSLAYFPHAWVGSMLSICDFKRSEVPIPDKEDLTKEMAATKHIVGVLYRSCWPKRC